MRSADVDSSGTSPCPSGKANGWTTLSTFVTFGNARIFWVSAGEYAGDWPFGKPAIVRSEGLVLAMNVTRTRTAYVEQLRPRPSRCRRSFRPATQSRGSSATGRRRSRGSETNQHEKLTAPQRRLANVVCHRRRVPSRSKRFSALTCPLEPRHTTRWTARTTEGYYHEVTSPVLLGTVLKSRLLPGPCRSSRLPTEVDDPRGEITKRRDVEVDLPLLSSMLTGNDVIGPSVHLRQRQVLVVVARTGRGDCHPCPSGPIGSGW